MTHTILKAATVALTLATADAAAARDVVVSSKIDTEGGLKCTLSLADTNRHHHRAAKHSARTVTLERGDLSQINLVAGAGFEPAAFRL